MSKNHHFEQPTTQQINELIGLFSGGRYVEAGEAALSLIQRYPQHPFGWKALGMVFQHTGQHEAALAPLQKAAELVQDDAQIFAALALALQDVGQMQEAEAYFRRALSVDASFMEAQINLGSLLQQLGRLDEAGTYFKQAVQAWPKNAIAHYNLGNLLKLQGQACAAETCFRQALALQPDYVQAHTNLAGVLRDQLRLSEAEAACRRALEIQPDAIEALANLGLILQEQGCIDAALAAYQRALEVNPALPEVFNNLGNALQDAGRLDDAAACYRRALELRPDYFTAHSNLLFMLNYALDEPAQTRLALAQDYGRQVAARVSSPYTEWRLSEGARPLRIGLVSGDFCNHPVGYFLEGILSHLDKASVELVAYSTHSVEDDLSARLRPLFTSWNSLVGLHDEAAAQLIHQDGIQILIDLSGHSRYNRLPVFAWKPAPVQVAWLGYFATTGVAAMDWLIADPWTLPDAEAEYFTETICRLPETRLCFTPPAFDIPVSALPALNNGYVTFGCFNNLTKMNDAVVALWSDVLHAVPHSRLFLKAKQLSDAATRHQTEQRFAGHGIDATRLILEGPDLRETYFGACHRVDIALDPFPYPGGTTTVENLWMGVPVLTLAGESFLARQGVGLLMNAGLPEWIAADKQDYVRRAVLQASDLAALAQLRARLREQVIASPIMDAKRFAQQFEKTLLALWQGKIK